MQAKKPLPSYVVINDEEQDASLRQVLRQKSQPFSFPLSDEDVQILTVLEAKYDAEINMSGLAAPQIGYSKAAIIFAVPDNEQLKKWRPDLTDTMPKSIWLNPQYKPIGDETHPDYEACFSVAKLAGVVDRYQHIKYTAWLPDGQLIEGEASGFLARVIQHETDHVNGILYIDKARPGSLMDMDEYRRKRAEAQESPKECLVKDEGTLDNCGTDA